MLATQSAKKAQETKIFVINNYKLEVEETTMYDHVVESAEETTSPRGVRHKMFIEEISGVIYQLVGGEKYNNYLSNGIITEDEYDNLSEEDQENYNFYGEATKKWQLREWMANGKSRVIETYDSEETANDEWYTRTYNYDFMPDDQRDTMYWNTREEAELELANRKFMQDENYDPFKLG